MFSALNTKPVILNAGGMFTVPVPRLLTFWKGPWAKSFAPLIIPHTHQLWGGRWCSWGMRGGDAVLPEASSGLEPCWSHDTVRGDKSVGGTEDVPPCPCTWKSTDCRSLGDRQCSPRKRVLPSTPTLCLCFPWPSWPQSSGNGTHREDNPFAFSA